MSSKCHICGNLSEFKCHDCEEPVCEDCCVPFTLQNQIDFTLCSSCHDGNEAIKSMEYWKEEERQDRLNKEKTQRNKKRRALYWKPENVEKRKRTREKKLIVENKQRQEMRAEAVDLVNSWFR